MILVTGGTGLVGAHLLFSLCKDRQLCRAIYRDVKGLEAVKKLFISYGDLDLARYKTIEWVLGDILDLEGLRIAFKEVNTVYHCAAHISFDPSAYKILKSVNVTGTANMVNLALDFKVSAFCYVSSIAALGKSDTQKHITEETDWNISDPNVYALTKYQAELEVWRGIWEGLSATIINPGVILGPGFWKKGSGKLFSFAHKGSPFYFPGGSGFVGVNDVVNAMLLSVKTKKWGERFICVSENISYQELFGYMADGFRLKKPTYQLPFWVLEILWRLDFIKGLFLKSDRKITKHTLKGLRSRDFYDSNKSSQMLPMEYTPINKIIAECCKLFKKNIP